MKIFGWDPGRMYDKIYYNDENDNEYVGSNINAVCRGYKRNVFGKENDIELIDNYLDVDVYEEDKHLGRFFVGKMGFKYNRGDLIISSNDIRKYSSKIMLYEKVRMVTHIANTCFKSGKEKDISCIVGSGVPTDEFFSDDGHLLNVKKDLSKRYKVKFNHHLFDSYEVEINVLDVLFTPEGTASGVTTRYKLINNIPETNEEILRELGKSYLVLNIGSSTTDGAVSTDEEFDSNGFFGLDEGSSTLIGHVINDVEDLSGYKTTKTKMDLLLQATSHISYEGKEIDIKSIADLRIKDLLIQFRVNLLNKLKVKNIEYKNLSGVYLTGGFVESLKISNYDALKNMLPIKTVISKNPLYDEAKGYFISAKLDALEKLESDKESAGFESDNSTGKTVIKVD